MAIATAAVRATINQAPVSCRLPASSWYFSTTDSFAVSMGNSRAAYQGEARRRVRLVANHPARKGAGVHGRVTALQVE